MNAGNLSKKSVRRSLDTITGILKLPKNRKKVEKTNTGNLEQQIAKYQPHLRSFIRNKVQNREVKTALPKQNTCARWFGKNSKKLFPNCPPNSATCSRKPRCSVSRSKKRRKQPAFRSTPYFRASAMLYFICGKNCGICIWMSLWNKQCHGGWNEKGKKLSVVFSKVC